MRNLATQVTRLVSVAGLFFAPILPRYNIYTTHVALLKQQCLFLLKMRCKPIYPLNILQYRL